MHDLRSETGAVLLEAALTIGVFLMAVGGGIELMRYAYYGLVAQYVVTDAARFGSLGAECPNCTQQVRVQRIETHIGRLGGKYGIRIGDEHICIRSDPSQTCGANNLNDNSGRPQQLMTIQINVPMNMFFGAGRINITAEAIAKNEPFAVR